MNVINDISIAKIWTCLTEVHDPEIPVVSIVDLGIVRDVQYAQDGKVIVTITPTYSGCPAMSVIAEDILKVLQRQGVQHVEMKTQLSPAWTTDWMTETGKRQLHDYGIAPPAQKSADIISISRKLQTQLTVQCPHCGSENTTCVSHFGSTSCKAQYRCLDCMEPFDYFKAH